MCADPKGSSWPWPSESTEVSKNQYSELVTVVILSAFIPILIAQQLFQPVIVDEEQEEALGAEDVAEIRRHGGMQVAPPSWIRLMAVPVNPLYR